MPNVLRDLFFYSQNRTVIHDLNPSLKILFITSLEIIAFALIGLQYSLPVLAFVILLLLVSKIPTGTVRTFLAGILWMMVVAQLSFTLIAPSMGGEVLFHMGRKPIYANNVLAGASISVRLAIMTLLSAVLVGTTSQREMVVGLRGLGVPYSVALAIGLTLRTVVTIATDWDIIRQAQYARCLDVNEGRLLDQMRKRASVGMLLTAALVNKMDHLSVALECRAVGSQRVPVEYHRPRHAGWEKALMWLSVAAVVIVVWLQWTQDFFS